MTTQEAYELMRTYLTRPGARRAWDDVCLYETVIDDATHRCAVGCLLTPATLDSEVHIDVDGGFDEFMWGKNVPLRQFHGNLQAAYQAGYEIPELDGVDHNFLATAQAVHDDIQNWENGTFNVAALDYAARKFGLKVVTDEPVVEGAPQELVVA